MESLNNEQTAAVTAPLGNILVLAGAGSGKTRVLVHRIAWLLKEHAVSPHRILAVTFTNKAAGEMRRRLESLLGHALSGLWAGTFHGLAHRLLRIHWREVGLNEHFQILDGDDQLQLIRRLLKSLSIDEERWEPKQVQNFICRQKDEGLRADQLSASFRPYDQMMANIYRQYETFCKENHKVDFSELILLSYELLQSNAELRAHYQARFSHCLVDEFQDTSALQYQWISLLAGQAASVMVVGDDDQSIYGWRGAKIENMTRFQSEFSGATIVRLEENYRSTGTILSAANAVILNNGERIGKTLRTLEAQGEPITLYKGFNEEDEALYIVRQIRAYLEDTSRSPKDIAILYRSNAQSRVLEEALMRSGIPYVIHGGFKFFERAEIKDALAYLRLKMDPTDNMAFERSVNTPPRGIGEKSLDKIREVAKEQGCSFWEAAKKSALDSVLTGKSGSGLQDFLQVIEQLRALGSETALSTIIKAVIEKSGLLRFFKEQAGPLAKNRVENLEELVNAACDFEQDVKIEEGLSPLLAFLSYATLDAGERSREAENKPAIQMMTLHSAKGLEFPVVFIAGLEEGLFPHHFSLESAAALEEERRLFYVGITRAMHRLFLTSAEKRRLFGREEVKRLSRFVPEIPYQLVKKDERRLSVTLPAGGNRSDPLFTRKTGLGSVGPFSRPSTFVGHGQTNNVRAPKETEGLGIGQRVMHPKFGAGTVIDLDGQGEKMRVHVNFDVYGDKWLALAFAQLVYDGAPS